MLLLGAAFGVGFAFSSAPTNMLLPMLALIGVFSYLAYRVRAAQRLEQRVMHMQEAAMRQEFPTALRLGWELVPSLTTVPQLHGRTISYIGHCLDQVKSYEAAIVAYDFLLERMPEDNLASAQLRIRRAIAQLLCDRLADADDALRRMRGFMQQFAQTTLGAAYRMAQLIQLVRTNHFAEMVAESDDLVEHLRPLGIEADARAAERNVKLGRGDQPDEHEQAQLWWSRATGLMSPQRLVDRFEELSPIAQRLRATDRPVPPESVS